MANDMVAATVARGPALRRLFLIWSASSPPPPLPDE
ncbi:hypothetical protein ACP70R_019653 [Stipagrostis hirtigluma subsp. patula]